MSRYANQVSQLDNHITEKRANDKPSDTGSPDYDLTLEGVQTAMSALLNGITELRYSAGGLDDLINGAEPTAEGEGVDANPPDGLVPALAQMIRIAHHEVDVAMRYLSNVRNGRPK